MLAIGILTTTRAPPHHDVRRTYHEDILERSRRFHERALVIDAGMPDSEHWIVAVSLSQQGHVALAEGNDAEAHQLFTRALAIYEPLGPDHPHLVEPLLDMGDVATTAGHYEEARHHYQRALAIEEATHGPLHRSVGRILNRMGILSTKEGNYHQASDFHLRALSILEISLGHTHPNIAGLLTGLGEALLGQAEHTIALEYLGRALNIRMSHEGDPTELAAFRWALARALWDAPVGKGRDRPSARQLAELSRATYERAGQRSLRALEEVNAWLAEHQD